MRKKSLLLLIKILLSLSIIGYSQTRDYRLKIVSENPFELYINDLFCYSGTEFDTIFSSGRYKFEVFLLNSRPKLSVYKQIIDLVSDTLINLNQSFPFTFKTKPNNAKVFIDSLFFGYTPISLNLLFRPKILSIQLNSHDRKFNLEESNNYNFEIEFEDYYAKTKKFYGYKYVALTSAIINGIFSTYYKQKADKFYYKPDKTPKDFELVKKYDNYSAIFTIGMEISFGIFVYLLFNE